MTAPPPESGIHDADGSRHGPPDPATPIDQLRRHLRKRFLSRALPPAILLGGIEAARARAAFDSLPYVDHATWDTALLLLSALFAVVLPVLYRKLFVMVRRGKQGVTLAAFYRFQNNRMTVALLSAWIAVAASLIAVPAPFRWGIFLLAICGAGIRYPIRRKLSSDAAAFGVGTALEFQRKSQ
jgi:hypothetical protein